MTGNFDLGLELQRIARIGPDRIALSDPQGELTYRELIAEAGGLAASLPPADGEARQPVALIMPQGARAIVGLVACLLAGRPYCALSPAQPRQRLEALLAEIEPELIWVTDERRRERLEAVGLPAADPIGAGVRDGDWDAPADAPATDAGHLCAVYVTSGTSGTPKLVGYRHASVLHRVRSYAAAIDAGPEDRFTLASPLWTAAAASPIFTALLSGASLHVLDPAGSTPRALEKRVRGSRATVWHSTPSLFRRLGGAGLLDGNRFRVVRLTGERLLSSDVELAQRICDSNASLVTGYSLTEANGVVSQKVVPLSEAGPRSGLDSGHPLDGIEVSIESGDTPLRTGVEGEIVVSGEFLSAGYLGSEERPAGTRFAERDGATVLHTGDRGVLHPDGSLEVRGRDDRRLKIHGQRVDPTEVEAAALRHDGVLDAALVPFTPAAGGTAAALFAASNLEGGPVAHRALQDHVGELVPPEAVPALVRVMESLPRTPAGKVDRLRLARLAEGGDRRSPDAGGHEDPLVDHMMLLWQEALEIDETGPDDDFFAAGGDSLASAEVCAAVESTYGLSLQPAVLLEHRSPVALAEHVRGILDGAPQVSASVVTFNPSGGEPPLFVVPGAGSDATALVHFADAIGVDQPVKVIQLPGADGRSKPVTRMDQITAHCLEAIRQTSVPPPYRIAGTSFGGLVAYDIASKLLRDGEQIAYLGLFDTPVPRLRRGNSLTRPLRRFSLPPNLSFRSMIRSPRRGWRRLRVPVGRLLADYRMVLSVLLGLRLPSPELRFRYLRMGCSIAADRWTPPPIPAPLYLYRCNSQPAHLTDAPRLGWDGLAPRIEVRGLPARHNRHIRPPAVSHLAALVNDDLRLTRSAEHSPLAGPPQLASS